MNQRQERTRKFLSESGVDLSRIDRLREETRQAKQLFDAANASTRECRQEGRLLSTRGKRANDRECAVAASASAYLENAPADAKPQEPRANDDGRREVAGGIVRAFCLVEPVIC